MSGDLLVLRLSEKETSEHGPIISYVFYDYKTNLYGVRCGYEKKNGEYGDFSYYAENKEMLLEFLLQCSDKTKNIAVSLMNYNITISNSDSITYDFLKDNDENAHEISGYTYNEEFEEEEEDDDFYPREVITRFMNIMESVYNEY